MEFFVFKKICNNIKPGAIITDVGSVKKEVINSVKKYIPKNIDFVPGHPIAGTENSGPESGFAGLFKNGWCILTPNKNTSKNSVKIIKYMWQLVGMKVDIMDSKYHDEVLAITSHIPHIIAYSIVGTIANLQTKIKKEVIKYAASGFRDFTRIAASDPIMWRDIILYNRQSILKMLNLFKKDLSKLEHAIENNNGKFLLNLFTKTRKIRKDIIKSCLSFKEIPDREEAIRKAISIAKDGDSILIAGKGHEKFQIIEDKKLPFSDQKIVKDIIGS